MWLSLALESVKLLENAYINPTEVIAVSRCRCTENINALSSALFDMMSNPVFKCLKSWNPAYILTLICKKVAK